MITAEEIILENEEELTSLLKVFIERLELNINDKKIEETIKDMQDELKQEMIYKYGDGK